jgi:hypothetical protein
MKTEEDEAFDDLAKRQGSWGGGFPAKRAMAADKFIAAEERKVGERYGYVPKLHPSEWMNAHPAQEPVQREWVGLTDDEIEQGNKESWVTKQAFESAVWWAEAKLKEKNT